MPTRRVFLQSAAAGLTLSAASYARIAGANERLQLGVVGSGNRGKTILTTAAKLGNDAVALCDIAAFRMDALSNAVLKEEKQSTPKQYKSIDKLLEHKGLDAVIVTTPDHHHKDCLLACLEAEKDVYIEKPLTKSLDEGKMMIDTVRKSKRIVQVGNQRHSGPHWRRCRDIIQDTDFGDLVWVKVWDCRNWIKKDPFAVPDSFTKEQEKQIDWIAFQGKAAKRPFDPVRYWSWRWYWDYAGGLMTDIGAHQLDIVQWLSGVETPKSAVANGGVYHFKHWETPDVVHGVWDYGKFAATFNVEFVNGFDGVGCTFYGTKMTLWADAEKEVRVYKTIDKPLKDEKPFDSWKIENETTMHVRNWVECVKSKKEPNSPIELGHKVIVAAHLANLSYRIGKKVYWDAEKQEVIGV
ncbi:MAG: Gfo/Idh/MocA family oxidoreductase [Gemmataceae bacterium]